MGAPVGKYVWLDAYAIGDAEIDAQHRRIVDILNLLHDLLHSDAVGDDFAAGLREVFAELHAYIALHFEFEEARLAEAGYPTAELAAHRAEHAALGRRVRDFENALAGGDAETIAGVLPFLYGDWLIAHICGADRCYAPWLRGP